MDLFRPAPLGRTNLAVARQFFFFLLPRFVSRLVFNKLMVLADNLPCFFSFLFFLILLLRRCFVDIVLAATGGEKKPGNITMHISLPSDSDGAGVGGSAVSADGWWSRTL